MGNVASSTSRLLEQPCVLNDVCIMFHHVRKLRLITRFSTLHLVDMLKSGSFNEWRSNGSKINSRVEGGCGWEEEVAQLFDDGQVRYIWICSCMTCNIVGL